MKAFYNDNDRKVCAWLRELIKQGHITDGVIDDRPIQELNGSDLAGYERVHLFAGIGGWDYALGLAGWTGPVWTGSCPCQPFSAAGRRKGNSDERHLWPEMFRLMRESAAERGPVPVFGEQVASAIGHGWLDGVSADLEGEGYAVGATVLGAHSVGSPHIRQRLYWVADAESGVGGLPILKGEEGLQPIGGREIDGLDHSNGAGHGRTAGEGMCATQSGGRARAEDAGDGCPAGGLAIPKGNGLSWQQGARSGWAGAAHGAWVGDTNQPGSQRLVFCGDRAGERTAGSSGVGRWDRYELVWCLDPRGGPALPRRIRPSSFPLVDGISRGRMDVVCPARLGQAEVRQVSRAGVLKGAGNAICPQVAAAFISAYMEVQS